MMPEQFNINTLNKLFFSAFTFTAEVTEEIIISEYKGSTFRGGFGNSFKKLVCINPEEKNCLNCMINNSCSYFKIFEGSADEKTRRRLKITKTAPRPYVLEPPVTIKRKFDVGEVFQFNLILVGWAVDYLPYFIIVFERLGERYGIGKRINGKRGKFKILNIRSSGKIIYSYDKKVLMQSENKININSFEQMRPAKRVKVNFITPTRLEVDGQIRMLENPEDFKTFIIRLYGRLFRLQEIYCSDSADEYSHSKIETMSKEVKLVHSNIHWTELERVKKDYTREKVTKQKMKYGGFTGEVIFEGNIKPFLEIIKLGEYLHIGKHYTFGLGKYEILE
ncbi:MAG: CRISPR system precrRNA processing endoribonuclease RAMP protein Cas6 [Ignavibacteria bacterium]|jgi:hypothetical protein